MRLINIDAYHQNLNEFHKEYHSYFNALIKAKKSLN